MQGIITGFAKDMSGWVITIAMYTDDVIFINGLPPAGSSPYVVDTIHVAVGSTLAQANAAATAQVQVRRDEHAGIANLSVQVLNHVITIAG